MSPSASASTSGQGSWSCRIADRYALSLPPDLIDWFDNQVWKQSGAGEFAYPVDPARLLDDAPVCIWPGFMPPDILPIIGNRYGDWLCIRVGTDNRATEVVHWYHGGGDWIPWGRTLAEAIVFDQLRFALPGRRQAYADAPSVVPTRDRPQPLVRWAKTHLPGTVVEVINNPENVTEQQVADVLIDASVSEVAVRCELAIDALDSLLRLKLTPKLAKQWSLCWQPDVVRWTFDVGALSESQQDDIAGKMEIPTTHLDGQDWDAAADHATAVNRCRSDQGWSHCIAGWVAERNEQWEDAVAHYRRALMASAFTDQSIRFRMHWCGEQEGKFAAARLQVILAGRDLPTPDSPYLNCLLAHSDQDVKSAVYTYWLAEADTSSEAIESYNALYKAGWDLGNTSLEGYGKLLRRLADTAQQAGQTGRAAVAHAHANCFAERFRH